MENADSIRGAWNSLDRPKIPFIQKNWEERLEVGNILGICWLYDSFPYKSETLIRVRRTLGLIRGSEGKRLYKWTE